MSMRDVLERHNIRDHQVYSATELYNVLKEVGIIKIPRRYFNTNWIPMREKTGRLVLPRRGDTNRLYFTGRQVKGIIKAFLPGGIGKYDYRDEQENLGEKLRQQAIG